MFHVYVPATTANIGAGFDALGMALDFCLKAEVTPSTGVGEFDITIEGHGENTLPKNKEHLLYKAYCTVFEALGLPVPSLKIHIYNTIPLARGMGSSSSVIVMGIMIGHHLSGERLSQDDLLQLAFQMEGHPDNIAPALLGGFVASGVAGGKARCLKTPISPSLRCKLLIPSYELVTKTAREALPKTIDFHHAVENVGFASMVVASMYQNDLSVFGAFLQDHLHQPYRAHLVKGFLSVQEIAPRLGFLGACISGAGPTMIVFYEDGKPLDFHPLQNILQKIEIENQCTFQILDCGFSNQGAIIVKE